ncbi:MAG: glycosyltransferase family 4 protein [Chitinophagaceae bacterium]
MLDVLLTCIVSFIITFLAIPAIIKIADLKKLFDIPDGRKLHTKPIASLGGVGIFCGFFFSSIFFISSGANPEFQYLFAAAVVIFFLGLKDDILVISPTKKFLGQILAAGIIIHMAGLRIDSMHGLLGLQQLPEAFSIALTYITMIVVINAYNLIDGVDGLAGSLGLLTTTVFGTYFLVAGVPAYALLSFAVAGSLAAFLMFNFNPAKIFMGDSGSLMLGLINSILVLKFMQVGDTDAVAFPVESVVAVAVAILIVPLADTLRVFSIRISQGRSPFSPDRNHIHHLLLDRGLNHKYVTICCLLMNIFFITLAFFAGAMGPTYLLLFMAVVSLCLLGVLVYFKKPAKGMVAAAQPFGAGAAVIAAEHSVPKVVTMKPEMAVAEN